MVCRAHNEFVLQQGIRLLGNLRAERQRESASAWWSGVQGLERAGRGREVVGACGVWLTELLDSKLLTYVSVSFFCLKPPFPLPPPPWGKQGAEGWTWADLLLAPAEWPLPFWSRDSLHPVLVSLFFLIHPPSRMVVRQDSPHGSTFPPRGYEVSVPDFYIESWLYLLYIVELTLIWPSLNHEKAGKRSTKVIARFRIRASASASSEM